MKDVRKLVPRTPPEGLLEWAAGAKEELDEDVLLIETEWAEDFRLEVILDEWPRERRCGPFGPPAQPVRRAACCGGVGTVVGIGAFCTRTPGRKERAGPCAWTGIGLPVPSAGQR